jgi:predicted esterase
MVEPRPDRILPSTTQVYLGDDTASPTRAPRRPRADRGWLLPTLGALTVCASVACGDSGSDGGQTIDAGGETEEPDPNSVAVTAIAPPVPNDCITDVSAGDHTFSCGGITYLVKVDEQCTKRACGLIFDVHGATMSGLQQRDNTLLHQIAPQAGFIYVNPSATAENSGGTWDLGKDPPEIAKVFLKVIDAFHVNPKRIHVTGFSQGGFTTFYFLAHHNDILASAAPVAGALEDPDWATDAWRPRVPILVMNGIGDTASTITRSRALIDQIVAGLALQGGQEIKGDGHYSWKQWSGAEGMDLEYIEHDYGGQAVLAGHCIPGGIDIQGSANNLGINATTCTTGDIQIKWGELVLQWFIEHPKP